jgi:hypothetical protein
LSNVVKRERRTHLRTLRFSESLAHSLEKEAAEQGTTINALANSILEDYFTWNKKAREFGFISLHKPIFIRLLEGLDDEALARIGKEVLYTTWKEMADFWFGDSSPDRLLTVLAMRSRINPTRLRTRVTQEEGTYTIVLHHDFGPKWSIIDKSALQELVHNAFHAEPHITAGESVVTARFTLPPVRTSRAPTKVSQPSQD